jgi:hypothetical protein
MKAVNYKRFQEQAIYQTIEDLGTWLFPHVGRYTKALRPTLGSKTIDCLLDILRYCAAAYCAPSGRKYQLLVQASAELDALRMLISLSVSLRLTSHQQFAHASKLIGDLGKQLGGWLAVARKGEGG